MNPFTLDLTTADFDQLISCRLKLIDELERAERERSIARRFSIEHREAVSQIGLAQQRLSKVRAALKNRGQCRAWIKSSTSEVRKQSKRHTVSDHALVRWLERVHGIDINKLKDKVLQEGLVSAINQGEQQIINEQGFVYVIKNGAVITVLPPAEDEYDHQQTDEGTMQRDDDLREII